MKRAAVRVFAAVVAVYALAVLVYLVASGIEVGFTANDIYFVPALTGTAVGVFLSLKLPENRMGPLMTVMSATLVTLGLSNVIIESSLEANNDLLAVVAVQLSDLAWVTQFVSALVLLPLWFPTGRPIDRRWAWVGRIAIVSALVAEASFIFVESVCAYDSTDSDVCVEVPNPWGIAGMVDLEPVLLVTLAMAFPALASAFVRWRRAGDVERHQIKWFFVAAVGLLVAFLISFADLNQTLNEIVFASGLTGVWVAIAIAVLKLRLYEIDRILSRTVSYALVIAVLAAVYVGLVTAIGSQFEGSLAVAASTLAVAALFTPVRRRVQAWVDRHFNRSTYVAEQVMDEFAGSLRDEVDADDVIGGWVEVVEETMQPVSISVWTRS